MDEELKHLRNRFFLALVVAIVFLIPLLIFVINKFGDNDPSVIKNINNKETMLLLITEENCTKCREFENILKNNNVLYTLVNRDREKKYLELLQKLDMSQSEISPPSIVYIVEGRLYSSLINPESDELLSYIDINQLAES